MEDILSYFDADEQQWLLSNPKVKKDLFVEIDDISNVNPLENGEPDLDPFNKAITIVKFIIEINAKGILLGPYDASHFGFICKYFPDLNNYEPYFWQLFSFNCAIKKQEGRFSKERIYLAAFYQVLALDAPLDGYVNDDNRCYDMNTGQIQTISGMGINARFR
jgi:hypothetical protein